MRIGMLVLAALAIPTGATAQVARSARSAGLGGAGMVFARGVEAASSNPANLARESGWTLEPLAFGLAAVATGSSLSDVTDIAGARGVGPADLVARLDASGLVLFAVADGLSAAAVATAGGQPQPGAALPSLRASYGHLGFAFRSAVETELQLSRGVADLLVSGFDAARIGSYDAATTGFRSISFTETVVSYGRAFGARWAGGVSARWVRGGTLSQGRLFEPEWSLTPPGLVLPGAAVESRGGSGVALDLAVSLDVSGSVRLAAVLAGAAQHMSWDDDLVTHVGSIQDSDFERYDLGGLSELFLPATLDPYSASVSVQAAAENLYESAFLPTVLRVGAGWRRGATTVEILAALPSEGRLGDPWARRVSAGAEQGYGPLTLRLGGAVATDLRVISGGVGVSARRFTLDLAGGMFGGSVSGVDRSGAHMSLGLSLRGAPGP